MRAIVLVLLLSGCAPYWVAEAFELRFVQVSHISQEKLYETCARSDVLACTIRIRESGIAYVFLGPYADNCVLRHELRHAAGWGHDERPTYRTECG